jgi:hypothetical protein
LPGDKVSPEPIFTGAQVFVAGGGAPVLPAPFSIIDPEEAGEHTPKAIAPGAIKNVRSFRIVVYMAPGPERPDAARSNQNFAGRHAFGWASASLAFPVEQCADRATSWRSCYVKAADVANFAEVAKILVAKPENVPGAAEPTAFITVSFSMRRIRSWANGIYARSAGCVWAIHCSGVSIFTISNWVPDGGNSGSAAIAWRNMDVKSAFDIVDLRKKTSRGSAKTPE